MSVKDYYIACFYDILIPLVTIHKPELIGKDRNIVTKDYKLKLLNPILDEATTTREGFFSELRWDNRRMVVKKLIDKLLRLLF